MKPKTLVPLVIGLGVGFFAIKMGIDMVKKAKGAQGEEVAVLVSAKQIEVATKIIEPMLAAKKVPQALVPADAFTASKDLLGRVTAMTVAPGVPISKSMLAPVGSEPGLQSIIPPGMRAASVSVNEESSVAGFIMPGCHVDVSAVPKDSGPAKNILSNVTVGAVGQSMSRVAEDGKTVRMEKSVTLFLRPEEVQILHAATGTGNQQGRLRLSLRGSTKDPGDSMFAKMIKDAMTPRKSEPVVQSKKSKSSDMHVVGLVRGQEYQKLIFDSSGNMRRLSGDAPMPTDLASPSSSAANATPGGAREVNE